MTKFSELPTTTVLGDADLICLSQGGQSRAITGAALKSALGFIATGQKSAVSYFDEAPSDGDVTVVFRMPYAARLDELDHDLAAGSLSLAVKKNGVALSGLSAVGVTATAATASAAGTGNDNDLVVDDELSVTISGAAAAAALKLSFNFTRS